MGETGAVGAIGAVGAGDWFERMVDVGSIAHLLAGGVIPT
jgi:hypothetical protein